MDHFFGWNYGTPIGVFGFIILIVLLNGIFSVFRTRAKQEVLREAIRSGHQIDAEALRSLQDNDDESTGGTVTGGLILVAISIGLVFLGYQIGKVEADEKVFDIMLGVAGIPFMIGVVLLLSSLFREKKNK